jgi:hypothetical protein
VPIPFSGPLSSRKALKIMIATTIMAVVVIGWCALTRAIRGPANPMPPPVPDLEPKVEHREVERTDPVTGEVVKQAPCPVSLVAQPGLPAEPEA